MASISTSELAEDYKSSLEDLTFNSKWEIMNLTVIARENIHAAQAIARTIEDHINKTSPNRKLPALYLLDSIAKNVGTPYTILFQRNLYSTFMGAYTMVEPPIRRKLEEMLQTWKAAVPNSTSTHPVFSIDTTRKIDNALIKARTAALQNEQRNRQTQERLGLNRPMGRNTPPPPQFRNTPPPAAVNGTSQYTNGNGRSATGTPSEQNGHTVGGEISHHIFSRTSSYTVSQPVMNPSTPVGLPQLPFQVPPQLAGLASAGGSVDTLQSDIDRLIASTHESLLTDPYNSELQNKLQAMIDLRNIINTQQLPESQLAQVREQVRKIANPTPPPMVVAPPPPPPPSVPQPVFSTQDLAALLATTAGKMQFPLAPVPAPAASLTLPVSLPLPTAPPPPPLPQAISTGTDASSLFASLQKYGLLPGPTGSVPPAPQASLPFPIAGVLSVAPTLPGKTMTPPPTAPCNRNWRAIDVELKSASLKIPRPRLISLLDSTLSNKCSSCASRFEDSERGKKEKAAHLDWHFRVRQRMAESVKRGQNRSWYVGEEEWIRSRDDREDIASLAFSETDGNAGATADQAAEPSIEDIKRQYVVVPDAAETHKVCPICQEELHYVWHHETDEFVWMDAQQVGGRIYHASCRAEASKDKAVGASGGSGGGGGGGVTGSRSGTPDVSPSGSVKRKADDAAAEAERKVKIKREPML